VKLTEQLSGAFRLWLRRSLRRLGYDLHSLPVGPLTLRDLEFDLPVLVNAAKPTVIDVGANVGQSIDLFRRTLNVPRIFSFEPNPDLARRLHEKYAAKGVTIEAMAAGSHVGQSKFVVLENHELSSVLELDRGSDNPFSDTPVMQVISVPITTLDAYVRGNGIAHVDLLKIDTQGFDLQVLCGAGNILRNCMVDTILVEVNFLSLYKEQGSFGEVERLLAKSGYGLLTLYEINRRNSVLRWATACFRRRCHH
jgi:FkbM family methyltransferase